MCMKKALLLIPAFTLYLTNSYSQASFSTGALQVDINEYGRVELYSASGTQQLERASILVGSSSTTVFDYQNDAEQHEPTVLVSNPSFSDFEIYGAYDNTYSGLAPAVVVKLNAYGWTDGGYIILKYNVKNAETNAMSAVVGLDIIPYLNEEYGYDTVTYNNSEGVIRFHRGSQENMGIKLLSANLSSLYSFEWYEDYYVDTDYWTWMHYGSLQPQYVSGTADGPVAITAQDAVTLAPGESFDVYYALSLGADEQTMLNNAAAAVAKYQSVFTSVQEPQLSTGFDLRKNFPNPFSRSTRITYNLPMPGMVSLKIFDVLGNETATLVNSKQPAGIHTFDFDASGLPSGIYYCRLSYDNQVKTSKMLLIK